MYSCPQVKPGAACPHFPLTHLITFLPICFLCSLKALLPTRLKLLEAFHIFSFFLVNCSKAPFPQCFSLVTCCPLSSSINNHKYFCPPSSPNQSSTNHWGTKVCLACFQRFSLTLCLNLMLHIQSHYLVIYLEFTKIISK